MKELLSGKMFYMVIMLLGLLGLLILPAPPVA
jgi:hypothetical protein